MLKYIFLNISKNKELYIPTFILFALISCALMCAFAISENMIGAQERLAGKYAAVAIFQDRWSPDIGINSGIIDEEFIDTYIIPEYTTDYYAFSQIRADSDTLDRLLATLPANFFIEDQENWPMPFTLMAYSDIEKSTHFRIGDRRIKEGRFAESISECNISEELAELNGLSVGDYAEIWLYYYDPTSFTFEIVGIYEDYTEEYGNELVLVHREMESVITGAGGEMQILDYKVASEDNISRNQILTAAPNSKDLTAFAVLGLDFGYDVAVYYTHDEKSIMAYVDEIEGHVADSFVILDSAEVMRVVLDKLEQTRNSFNWLLVATVSGSFVFCGLIVAFVLKDRTYDIGVFRLRGLSRIKTAALITGEFFAVSLPAFASALALYLVSFVGFAEELYDTASNASDISMRMDRWSDAPLHNYGFSLPLTPLHFFVSFVVMMAFVAIIGFAIALLISRHEPMKTMTEH